jgi:hypothetical protein
MQIPLKISPMVLVGMLQSTKYVVTDKGNWNYCLSLFTKFTSKICYRSDKSGQHQKILTVILFAGIIFVKVIK